jgi:DNA-binding transcriptional LysR family regulator
VEQLGQAKAAQHSVGKRGEQYCHEHDCHDLRLTFRSWEHSWWGWHTVFFGHAAAPSIMVGNFETHLSRLRNGMVDVVLSTVPLAHTGVTYEPLYVDRFAVCCRPGHPLDGRRRISVADLAKYNWAMSTNKQSGDLHEQLIQHFLVSGLPPPKVAVECDLPALTHAVTRQTDLLTLRPTPIGLRSGLNIGLIELSVAPMFPKLSRGLSFREHSVLSVPQRRFVRILKETAHAFINSETHPAV